MSLVENDYPVDTGQILTAWLDEWAIMENARITRQQKVTLNTKGWIDRTMEGWARILVPDNLMETVTKRLKEAHNDKTK